MSSENSRAKRVSRAMQNRKLRIKRFLTERFSAMVVSKHTATMPNLALSRTARTLNSWSPTKGNEEIISPVVNLKEDVDLIMNNNNNNGQQDSFNQRPAFRPTSYEIKNNRRKQNRLLTSSRVMFEQMDGSGRGPVFNGNNGYNVDSQGFATQPIPGHVSLSHLNHKNNLDTEIVDEFVTSTNNRDVRFQVRGTPMRRGTRGINYAPNTSLKNVVLMDPSIGCSTTLILAESPESLAHLRKWNSQATLSYQSSNKNLNSKTQDGHEKEFPDKKTKRILKRNSSLPDLRQAKQLDTTKLHRARPKTEISENLLIRSPSDTGRALTFWMPVSEGQGNIKSFAETPAIKRNNNENKLIIFRNHWFNEVTELNVKPTGKITGQDDCSKDENSTDLSDFSAKTLAEELTLIGRELLLAVEPVELVTYVMKPRIANEETCPNLFRLLRFYERITALVASEILRSDNSTKRAQIMALIIEAAEKCRSMQNWQSSKALLAGIQCPPIARLQDSWTQLRQEYPDHNSTFESLINDEISKETDADIEKPRKLSAMPYFGEVMSRVRGRPTVSRLRPARPLWKEPPSLAKWVEEQISIALTCDTCNSTVHKNRACCYLMVFVLGKNFFCPVRRMPEAFVQNTLTSSQDVYVDNHNFRLDLTKVFDDPESLPFSSSHVQCSALQPGNTIEVRHRAEIYLRSAQATARAYDLECNQRARNYLLKKPYSNLSENMIRSYQIEPSSKKLL